MFEQVSESAKDFIRRLLVPHTSGRMTVHEALDHAWLSGGAVDVSRQIPSQKYYGVRDSVRERYVSLFLNLFSTS